VRYIAVREAGKIKDVDQIVGRVPLIESIDTIVQRTQNPWGIESFDYNVEYIRHRTLLSSRSHVGVTNDANRSKAPNTFGCH
jgi:hypothetical protein